MTDEKPRTQDDAGSRPERSPASGNAPKERDSLVDGRLDPDAQSPADETAKPFDPNENDPAATGR
ncbi:hypothetical protein [uncultured Methylobacterium sp.]|uniref:hypothetical protein n=1 Tax=uncultured Methylobacterium sp. TaxID=157278 RepID=UPI00262C544D|nr:hypothetical protein [uncultured Methylobacterium sp.]